MNTYPADEQRISEVERGRSCRAIVPLRHGERIAVGDTVLFALSRSRAGEPPVYVKEGDSVLVCLTEVIELDGTDPASGQPLVRLTWKPLGQADPPAAAPKRASKFSAPKPV